jgi:hypothetical protein
MRAYPKRAIKPASERFWNKVEKTDSCWLWRGAITTTGYGVFQKGRKGELLYRVHRFSFELHFGEIEQGKLVLHKCDTKTCVNPDHLELGDHKKNLSDAWNRGLRKLTSHHLRLGNLKRKLSDDQRIFIINEFNPNVRGSGVRLARLFNVSKSTISSIARSHRKSNTTFNCA